MRRTINSSSFNCVFFNQFDWFVYSLILIKTFRLFRRTCFTLQLTKLISFHSSTSPGPGIDQLEANQPPNDPRSNLPEGD